MLHFVSSESLELVDISEDSNREHGQQDSYSVEGVKPSTQIDVVVCHGGIKQESVVIVESEASKDDELKTEGLRKEGLETEGQVDCNSRSQVDPFDSNLPIPSFVCPRQNTSDSETSDRQQEEATGISHTEDGSNAEGDDCNNSIKL